MPHTDAERAIFDAGRAQGVAETLTAVAAIGATLPALVPPGVRTVTLADLAQGIARVDPATLRTLRPYDPAEAVDLKGACHIAGRSPSAVRDWCERYGIGRAIVGTVMVSRPALAMLLDGDVLALGAYLTGDRSSSIVAPYFARCGLVLAA